MRFYILLILFSNITVSFAQTQNDNLFITNYEYGQMLYKNPRGIGCVKCHGKDGKGSFVARYTHKKKKFEINAPAINTLSLTKFIKTLKSKSNSRSIMPTYFLTNDEMKQIHFYITNRSKDD